MNTYYWIGVPILAMLMDVPLNKVYKIYNKVIVNNSIPLEEIAPIYQEQYVNEILLKDNLIDFSFLNAIKDYDEIIPLYSKEVQELFKEMEMIRKGIRIKKAYGYSYDSVSKLKELAKEYGISYSTYARRKKIYMNNTSLSKVLMHGELNENEGDRYHTCCMYCRDLIIYLHLLPGRISASKIFRDIKNGRQFPCGICPYNPNAKHYPNKKTDFIPDCICKREVEYMVKPNNEDTVNKIISRIPEQEDVLAWKGVKSWASRYHYTPLRNKPEIVNQVWFSDHKQLDIFVRTKRLDNGKWEVKKPWITAIIDAASNVMVSYVLSLNPNSDCIKECFARACAFTVDTPYYGIPDYFYIDNGKDYRSNGLKGLPNSEDTRLLLNKEFCESGILEWFGIKVIHSIPFRGRSKTIESIWKTIDKEWIKPIKGYCGESPRNRPYILDEQVKNDDIYIFEQFVDYFADKIYPAYNDFSVTNESPNYLYNTLPKTKVYVPTWATLSVLKSTTFERVIRSKGIKFDNKYYWTSKLGPLIESEKSTKYRIFAFDTPFNRNISVVKNHKYIGEAHLIEKLNVVEKRRHKVIEHIREQQLQHKFYSNKLSQLHSIIYESNILSYVEDVPFVDNIRYGQAIDIKRDKEEANDDNQIPKELKEQALKYANNYLEDNTTKVKPGRMSQMFTEIGKNARIEKGDKRK